MTTTPRSFEVFCSFVHQDQPFRDKLRSHLAPLQRQGFISIWHDSQIEAGTEPDSQIKAYLNSAQIILLLVSADYLASDYAYSVEMARAIERHAAGEVYVIPLIIRPVDWRDTPLNRLQVLPTDGKPVSMWSDQDEALSDIANGIRKAVVQLRSAEVPDRYTSFESVIDDRKQTRSPQEELVNAASGPDGRVATRPITELDEDVMFRRLSPSSYRAFNVADGIRVAAREQVVHIEYLIAGLLAKKGGPAEELLGKAQIDVTTLGAIAGVSLPQEGSYTSSELTALPPLSDHVRKALIVADDVAGSQAPTPVRTRHLLYGVLSVTDCHTIQKLLAQGIHKEDINLSPLPSSSRTPARPVISGFTSDDPTGQDLLGITREVEALCSVVAAKDVEPPISLGLFGDWGSGKSFFMRMMQERLEVLQKKARVAKPETAFCENIVQLTFNAWHYIDTDLWASLTSEIIVGLARSLFSKEDTDSKYKHARLQDEISKAKDELVKAEQKTREAKKQLDELDQQASTIESELTPQALIQGMLNAALQQPEVSDAIKQAKKQLDSDLRLAARELNFPPDSEKDKEVKLQIEDLTGMLGRIRALIIAVKNKKGIFKWQLIVIAFFTLLVVFLAVYFKDFLVGLLGTVIAVLAGTIAPIAPLIPSALRAVGFIKKSKKSVEQAQQKELEKIKSKVEEAREKHQEAENKVKDANKKVQEIVQELETLRADHQIAEFIKQRQASTDYTQYLGVIAKARKDFEQLSFLLKKDKEEAAKGDASPDNQVKRLLPPIDRIILYIDDLDRCPEKRVVEVLQAVHLLLAFPLFVVVVGVDSRWLLHSLKHHYKTFQGDATPQDEFTEWQSTPLNYLEKIFQIPFTLRPMRATGFEQIVDTLASQRKTTLFAEAQSAHGMDEDTTKSEQKAVQEEGEPPTQGIMPEATEQPTATPLSEKISELLPPEVNALLQEDIDMNPASLRIEDWERTVMKRLYRFIPSPRAAKRFVNVYRLLKASIDDQKMQAFIGNEYGGQHRAALLLLAMLIGYPSETTEIFCNLLEREHNETWWNFIDSFEEKADTSNLSSIPGKQGGDAEVERWQLLMKSLADIRSLIPENQPCADFVEWAPQVARYSYQSRSILFAL